MIEAGALGDTVLQLHVARALRTTLRPGRLAWLGRDSWLPIVRRCETIDEATALDAIGAHRLFAEGQHIDDDLAAWLGQFDWIVNGIAAADSPAGRRLQRCARQDLLTHGARPDQEVNRHVTAQWLDQLIEHLDSKHASCERLPESTAPASDPPPQNPAERLRSAADERQNTPDIFLRPRPADVAAAEALLAEVGLTPTDWQDHLILLHPGSGGLSKCWPIDRYAGLSETLARRGFTPVLLFGPAEMERAAGRPPAPTRTFPAIEDPSLAELLGLFSLARAYVGNDSGPTHTAAAAGTATVALFGPTAPHLWRPLGPRVQILQSRRWQQNWSDLPPDTVAAALTAT